MLRLKKTTKTGPTERDGKLARIQTHEMMLYIETLIMAAGRHFAQAQKTGSDDDLRLCALSLEGAQRAVEELRTRG